MLGFIALGSVSKQISGLDVCGDTIVGNDMQRGISGGQKKRVTTGMLENSSEQITVV